MSHRPRILFVGDDWYGSNATSLRDAFVRSGCEVVTINTRVLSDPIGHHVKRVWKRTARRSYDRIGARTIGQAVQDATREHRFDLLLAFKALRVSAATLDAIAFHRVHYHPDDSSNPAHRSLILDEAESQYDLHITTKSFNVAEINERTNKPAHFVWCAYDRGWHRPVPMASDHLFGFIGTRRADREQLICNISDAHRGELLISGSGWSSLKGLKSATVIPGAFGIEFSKVVARAPIQLGLLNSDNRDLHTCRSFEVPAAGALIVAERTVEHSGMFVDGEDALLFDDETELLEILDRLRHSERLASTIRSAGHRRITTGANTYDDRALEILKVVAQL